MHYFERLNIYTATIIHYMENLNKLPLIHFIIIRFLYVFAYYFIIKRDLSCFTCRVYIHIVYLATVSITKWIRFFFHLIQDYKLLSYDAWFILQYLRSHRICGYIVMLYRFVYIWNVTEAYKGIKSKILGASRLYI